MRGDLAVQIFCLGFPCHTTMLGDFPRRLLVHNRTLKPRQRGVHLIELAREIEHAAVRLDDRGTQPGGLFDEQPSARHIYPHAIPALYARCVDGLTVKDSTVRFVGENEAWDGSVAELEHCRRAKLELEKLV